MQKLANTRIALVLIWLSFFCSSWDIAGNIDNGGFNIRLCHLLLLPISLYGIRYVADRHLLRWPVGGLPLLIWAGLLLVFMFRSPNLLNAVGYEAWLLFNVFVVFGVAGILRSEAEHLDTFRVYLNSFAAMAFFGWVQFGLCLIIICDRISGCTLRCFALPGNSLPMQVGQGCQQKGCLVLQRAIGVA